MPQNHQNEMDIAIGILGEGTPRGVRVLVAVAHAQASLRVGSWPCPWCVSRSLRSSSTRGTAASASAPTGTCLLARLGLGLRRSRARRGHGHGVEIGRGGRERVVGVAELTPVADEQREEGGEGVVDGLVAPARAACCPRPRGTRPWPHPVPSDFLYGFVYKDILEANIKRVGGRGRGSGA